MLMIIVKHRLHVYLGGVPGPLGGLDTPGLAGAGAHLLLLPPTLPATRRQVLLITTIWKQVLLITADEQSNRRRRRKDAHLTIMILHSVSVTSLHCISITVSH